MSNQINRSNSIFYGSRLFLKFFFWFWAIAAVTTVLVGFYAYYFHIEPEMHRFDQIHYENTVEAATYMAEAYEKEGEEAAAAFAIKGIDWFFDENLNNLLKDYISYRSGSFNRRLFTRKFNNLDNSQNRQLPAEAENFKASGDGKTDFGLNKKAFASFSTQDNRQIASFAARIFNNDGENTLEIENFYFQGCLVKSSTGKHYVAIRYLPWKKKNKHLFMVGKIIEALPLLILISAPLCFFLGRYMARPVIEISEASRKFAAGELATRVDSNALQRFDEIGDLAADFNQMAQRLEDMIKGQHRLLGDISHELRSPLARLQVALELLAKKSGDDNDPMFKRIEVEISRIDHLIGQILELNRIGNNPAGDNKEPNDITELVEKLCDDGQFEASVRNVKISYSSSKPVLAKIDRSLLEKAVENILRNAILYSPESSEIRVEVAIQKQKVCIVVLDQGPGIPQEHLARIFEPFYRCQEARERKSGGAGLGLAIAQQAVKAHSGEITIENIKDGGLRVEISLPL